MIELKQVYDEDCDDVFIQLNNKLYQIVGETRGVREKFWMVMQDSKVLKKKQPMSMSHILFKSSRNDVSCENWGEVYASALGKQCNLPVVDYYMATLQKDGKSTGGVMCGSYFSTGKEIEMSAYQLHQIFSVLQNKGQRYTSNEYVNTIEGMLKEIQSIPGQTFFNENIAMVRRELYKQAIFDFVLAQTDRHWFNTTFLIHYNPRLDKGFISKAPCYDNGCIAMLKRKASAIVGMSKEIEATGGKNSPYLKDRLEKYCPMMGVSTPLVRVETSRKTGEDDVLVVDDPIKSREIFLDELCRVIADDAELSMFLIELTDNLNVDAITAQLKRGGDDPPESIAKLIKNVVGHQLDVINQHMKKITNQLSAERGGYDE